MCTYSADADGPSAGVLTPFHYAHYVARAAGGVGLVMVEATAVQAVGRITPHDLGLWNDEQVAGHAQLVAQVHASGAKAGVQLAHAGRKASVAQPWHGGKRVDEAQGGWTPVAPSEIPFRGSVTPEALSVTDVHAVTQAFVAAARRADAAGYDVIELHAAHGYLLHAFLSPIANDRTDEYGGSFENRTRLLMETVDAVRAVWPAEKPVFVRISSTDWVEENPDDDRDSWTLEQSVRLTTLLAEHGVDLIDASSGGIDVVPIPRSHDYQSTNATVIRARSGVPTAAVGRIDVESQAHTLVDGGHVDAVFLGRALLRNPSWANDAAARVGVEPRFLQQYDHAL